MNRLGYIVHRESNATWICDGKEYQEASTAKGSNGVIIYNKDGNRGSMKCKTLFKKYN